MLIVLGILSNRILRIISQTKYCEWYLYVMVYVPMEYIKLRVGNTGTKTNTFGYYFRCHIKEITRHTHNKMIKVDKYTKSKRMKLLSVSLLSRTQ